MASKKNYHNKKRNSAFLYEALTREMTKSILQVNENRKRKILHILKKSFNKKTLLSKELEIYKSLYETKEFGKEMSEKLVNEAKRQYDQLDKKQLQLEKTDLINLINKSLSKGFYNSFVPNYKSLATIYQIFNEDIPVKERILLEQKMIEILTEGNAKENNLVPIDNLVYKTFINKFNEKYSSKLLQEQSELIKKFALSFSDNGIELKAFLNEEIGRLKEETKKALNVKEIKEDKELLEKTNEVSNLLESYKNQPIIDENNLQEILKIQQFIQETKE